MWNLVVFPVYELFNISNAMRASRSSLVVFSRRKLEVKTPRRKPNGRGKHPKQARLGHHPESHHDAES